MNHVAHRFAGFAFVVVVWIICLLMIAGLM